jgi:hypothetical protein
MIEPFIQATTDSTPSWDDLRIECVTFDPAGLPKRRRLVSFLAMLQPLSARPELTRRRVLAQSQPTI